MSPAGVILFILFSTIAAGALAFAFLQPRIAKERKVENRRAQYTRDDTERRSLKVARDRLKEQDKRRKTIQSSLKELESRQKERDKHTGKLTLQRQLEQAGWTMSVKQFVLLSIAMGFVSLFVAAIFGAPLLLLIGAVVVGGLGLPRFLLSRARKKRFQRFGEEFPNAIDLIVRGVKSGLPLNDTLRIVSGETLEPVRSEFRKIIESQQMGVPISEAVEKLYRNIPTPEANFFAIVIAIQSQAGGNLSEALGNLSNVLRDRKKMRAKVQAMSMEAKASGGIIGALPVVVASLVYITTPDYISVLFTSGTGHLILAISGLWMATGVFVMKKMISFDF